MEEHGNSEDERSRLTRVPCTLCIPKEVRVKIDSYDTTPSGWR